MRSVDFYFSFIFVLFSIRLYELWPFKSSFVKLLLLLKIQKNLIRYIQSTMLGQMRDNLLRALCILIIIICIEVFTCHLDIPELIALSLIVVIIFHLFQFLYFFLLFSLSNNSFRVHFQSTM